MHGFKPIYAFAIAAIVASLATTASARAEDDGGFSQALGGMVLPESDPAPAPIVAPAPAPVLAPASTDADPGTFVLNRASFDSPSPEPAK